MIVGVTVCVIVTDSGNDSGDVCSEHNELSFLIALCH